MKNTFHKTAIFILTLFTGINMQAQLVYTDAQNTTVTISSDQGGVCASPTGYTTQPFTYDNNANINFTFATTPPAQYFKAKYGAPVTITIDVTNPNGIFFGAGIPVLLIGTDSPTFLYDQDNLQAELTENLFSPNNQFIGFRYRRTVAFARADTKGYIVVNQILPSGNYGFILPFVVEGPLTNEQVPILGTTTQPQLPYFILHAPPGDGSTAEFQETKTVCREIVQSAASDNSNSGYVDVKVGVAGSAGFIVTTNFEFSVTVGFSAGGGEMNINTQGNQTCMTVTEGFQTPPGGEDVFVGYGIDFAYGVYNQIAIDPNTCSGITKPYGLAYVPTGQPRQFYYTTSEILDQISVLQSLANNDTLSARERNVAQNQVDVWNKVLALNQANINNPNNVQIGAVSFGAVPSSQESGITVTETAAIEYEQYLDFATGVDVVIEVAGSGVSGGHEYRNSQRYGKIENQSQEVTKIVRYTLSDDDPGDLFNVNIFRDPMFGTPVFRTAAGSRSSCPYQTGFQRDQPKLKHDGTSDTHITLAGNPIGSSATFKIDLCNESNEARTYSLELNAQSNLNGAVVSAAGVPLNGNDLGQSFTVPANSCIQDLVVEVKQLSLNSPLAYPNLELFLYAACEEAIQSSVFASVFFGNATGTDEANSLVSELTVSPNPCADATYLDFEMIAAAPVRLELSDLQGQVVRTEALGDLPAGKHRYMMELNNLPNGMYFMTLQSQGTRTYRKIVVQR